MDDPKLWSEIGNAHVWILCGICFGLGAIGGFIQAIGAEPPIKLREEWWKRLLVGGVAAVAVLYVTDPDRSYEIIAGSLVAGFAGQALLAALAARLLLDTAQKRTAEAKQELRVKAEEAGDAKQELRARVEEMRTTARDRDTAIEAATLLLDEPVAMGGGALPSGGVAPASARIAAARGMLSAIRRTGGVA